MQLVQGLHDQVQSGCMDREGSPDMRSIHAEIKRQPMQATHTGPNQNQIVTPACFS